MDRYILETHLSMKSSLGDLDTTYRIPQSLCCVGSVATHGVLPLSYVRAGGICVAADTQTLEPVCMWVGIV